MAFVSQLLNHAGDVFGFRGFQTTVADGREAGGESGLKPLHPEIWLQGRGVSLTDKGDMERIRKLLLECGYVQALKTEIRDRKDRAMTILRNLELGPSRYLDALTNFISAPELHVAATADESRSDGH